MYICITDSLCCTAEINNIVNQLHFNKINVLKALTAYINIHIISVTAGFANNDPSSTVKQACGCSIPFKGSL